MCVAHDSDDDMLGETYDFLGARPLEWDEFFKVPGQADIFFALGSAFVGVGFRIVCCVRSVCIRGR